MMDINKIAFIFPPSTLNTVGVENSFIPNGILTLASQIEKWKSNIEIKVYDGSVKSADQIIVEVLAFNPQIVGVSALCSNYAVGKQILQHCHQRGMVTIIGNHHANFLWSIIPTMKKNLMPELDFIITGNSDGQTLIPLLEKIENGYDNFNEIDNVCYKLNGNWIRPSSVKYKTAILSFPDLKFIDDFEPYFNNYRKVFKNFHSNISEVKAININLFKGCTQGSKKPCVYCCLKDHRIISTEPTKFWEHIQQLYDNYGFNFFWETANSLTSLCLISVTKGRSFLEELVEKMPEKLKNNISFMIYARADEINPSTITLLKKMNVSRVVIGLDSGDASILKLGLQKENVSEGMNYEVAKMLDESEIQIYGCYVPGAVGETVETLEKTKNEVFKIMELNNCCAIEYTSLAPMPGSIAWAKVKTEFFSKYGVSDVVDVEKISKFWVNTKVLNVDWQMIEDIKQAIKQKSSVLNIVFGGYY